MFTATLNQIGKADESLFFSIVYTDGVQKIVKSYKVQSLDDDVIKSTARNEIAGLERVAASTGKVTINLGQTIDTTPPVVTAPEEDKAKTVFISAYRDLQRAQRGVSAGLIPDASKELEIVRTLYLPEYAEFL